MNTDKVVAKMKSDVATFGWHCLSVLPREGQAGEKFTYTIGLKRSYDHPEIMVFGLHNQTSQGILHDCVEMIRNGVRFLPDVEYADILGGGYKVVFRTVRPECISEYFGLATRFYENEEFSGLVMFWPDKAHCFPWQEASSTAQREALTIVQATLPADDN